MGADEDEPAGARPEGDKAAPGRRRTGKPDPGSVRLSTQEEIDAIFDEEVRRADRGATASPNRLPEVSYSAQFPPAVSRVRGGAIPDVTQPQHRADEPTGKHADGAPPGEGPLGTPARADSQTR